MATYIERRHTVSGETHQTGYLDDKQIEWALSVLEQEYGTEDYVFITVYDSTIEEGN